MQFKVIKNGDGLRKHSCDIIKKVIEGLEDNVDSYLVVEPKYPIQNVLYLEVIKEGLEYVAETKLMSSDGGNYKNYSKRFATAEDVFSVFRLYYEKFQIPDLSNWTDEAAVDLSDCLPDMIKLYKREIGITKYFEIWLNDDDISLSIHTGSLGEVGQSEDVFFDEEGDLPVRVGMNQIVEKQKAVGFSEIDNLTEVVFQLNCIGQSTDIYLQEKKDRLEVLLNECLGWTGNGHCDGGYADSGVICLFCYVVDRNIAVRTILDMLSDEKCVEGEIITLAYLDAETEEYYQLYPEKDKPFDLLY